MINNSGVSMDDVRNKLEKIDSSVDKLDAKLDRVDQRLDKIEIQQAVMTTDLKYHIKRTNILEAELKPIQTRYQEVMGVIKFVGAVIAVVGAVETCLHLTEVFGVINFLFHT